MNCPHPKSEPLLRRPGPRRRESCGRCDSNRSGRHGTWRRRCPKTTRRGRSGACWRNLDLADFRVVHQAALDDLLTQIVASLMAAGAVALERVAQDGMRVRASTPGPT